MVAPTKTGLPPAKTATKEVPWKTKDPAPAPEPDHAAEAMKKIEKIQQVDEKLEKKLEAMYVAEYVYTLCRSCADSDAVTRTMSRV